MNSQHPSPLDPVVIAQLGNLQLRARRILDGLYSGHHENPIHGNSQDFSEHRAYHPGDDLKGIDWKAFGRTDRLVIKKYEEETNMASMILLDDSASMGCSWGGRLSKLDYAKTLAAALGYLLISQRDGVGLLSRGTVLQANSSRSHLDPFFASLESVQPQGIWNVSALADSVGPLSRKRSMLIVISDLMADSEKTVSTLLALHARKHEVIVLNVFDPAERDLPFSGPIVFEDVETGETLQSDPDVIRAAYQRLVQEKLATLAHVFRSAGLDYHFLTTDTPFDKGLGAYLSWRSARL